MALKDGAFADVANNLTTAADGSVLDARQGKALYDAIKKVDLTSAVSYTVDSSSVGAIQANSLKCYRYGNMVHLEFVLTFSSSQTANCTAWRADMTGLPQPISVGRGVCGTATYSTFIYTLSAATNDVNTLRVRFAYNGSSASSSSEYPIVIEYLTDDV